MTWQMLLLTRIPNRGNCSHLKELLADAARGPHGCCHAAQHQALPFLPPPAEAPCGGKPGSRVPQHDAATHPTCFQQSLWQPPQPSECIADVHGIAAAAVRHVFSGLKARPVRLSQAEPTWKGNWAKA